jgi:hypothetical protein
VTISNLNNGATYYFVLNCYTAAGVASAFNGELSYTVPPNPVTTNQPANQVITAGGTASFSVAASGTASWSYQWSCNGTNITGATNSTLTLNDLDLSQAGNYAVLVTDNTGSIQVFTFLLTVAMAPIVTGQPANQSVLLGCEATFNASADGTGPLTYQWWRGGSALDGQTNQSMTLTNVQTPDFGSYCVVVTNVFGSITSAPAQLALGQPPAANPDTVYRFGTGGVRVNANVLLANDTVAQWDSLTVIGVSPNSAAGGTVGLTNNWIYYAPSSGITNGIPSLTS